MRPGKQQQQQQQQQHQSAVAVPHTEDYPERIVHIWWDHILTFFVNHRACAALALWLAVFLFDAIDTHVPAEWLVFTLFSFSVFVHAFAMSVLLFAALTAAMTLLNVAVFYLLPFEVASTCSTIVVCMLLVRAVHGLDSKGWAITALMAISRLGSPWCESLPNYLQAPIAAYCTSFAIIWLAYHNARRIERLVDPISLFLGVVPPPKAPRIYLVAIHDKSVEVSWEQLPSPYAAERDNSVPASRVTHYEIELNGHIVSKHPSTVVHSPIDGLLPASMYQLRIWAVSASRGRSPSLPVFFTTLTIEECLAQNGPMPAGDGSATVLDKDVGTLRAEIEASQRTIQGLQSNIATIKAQADMERVRLQEEISALRAQRKEEESSQAAQRETIRHLEAEKRHLESERMRLDKDIANALAKKQRAQDSIREQGRQADTYLRNAKSIEANMEKQRQDHHQQQTELQATIASLKEEVDKAKQNLESLTSQHTELASSLRIKRVALAVQEKKNAELDLKVKEALQKKRQMKESQAEIVKSTARMQAEIDVLTPQLEQVIRERRRLEMSAKMSTSATFPPPGFSTALSHPSIYGVGGDIGAADLELSSALSYPVSSIPAPASQSVGPGTSRKTNNGTRHVRSSSFATSPINAPQTAHASSAYKPAAQRNAPNGGQAGESIRPTSSLVQIGYPHGIASASASTSRRSADFDIFGYLDRDSPRVASAKGDNSLATTGLLPPLRMNSRDIDSTSLRYASNGSGGYTHSMPSTSMAIFTGTSNVENGEYAPRLSSMAFWGEPVVSPSSLSSTTAEASALSILKDTDLAYPTPERHSFRAVGQYGELRSHRQEFRTPPPSAPTLPSGLAHQSLNRMLSSSMEGLVDPHHHQHHHGGIASTSGDAPHSRFGSIDLRAGSAGSGSGWPEFDFSGSGDGWESGRSSTVNDRHTSPCADMNSFSLLRSATPVEPQPLRLSGDMLAVHRPHVEPIGAPIRRKPVGGGSPSPNDVNVPPSRQLSHPPSHPPVPSPAPIQFPPGFQMRREMSHPSSFGYSLYHKRSLWDHQEASAESSSPAQNAADMALESGNAPHGTG